MLAEVSNPTEAAVGSWIGVYAFLIVAVFYTIAVIQKFFPKSPNTNATVATQKELEKIDTAAHGRMKRERQEIDAEIKRVEAVAEKRADKLETKLDENTKLTSQMNGQLGQMNQNISVLTNSITNFMRDQARHQS